MNGIRDRKFFLCVLPLLAFVLLLPGTASAQVLYGSMIGTVTDASGALIPNASITVASAATGLSREVKSDEAGRFSILNLPEGAYDVTVSAAGFRPFKETGRQVVINVVTRLDIQLEVGPVTEAVTVSASAAMLTTDKADVHYELNANAITNLPLPNYRNFQSLINLVPGATPAVFQNAVVDTPERALRTFINGTNPNNNNMRVDGAANVFLWLPHHALYVPPVESVETANISTSSFDAEQGMTGGAAVTVTTKSGTNELHGVAFLYHDNQHLRARNYFLRTPGKPKSITNITGGNLGGPIKKNTLFFFANYERYMERSGQSGNYSVPTADQRLGDFSAYSTKIFDPLSGNPDGSGRTQFALNKIPADRLSPIVQKILTIVPLPNQPGLLLNNFANSGTQSMDRDNYDGKINWTPSSSFVLWGKYSRMGALVNGPAALGEAGGSAMGTRGTGDTTTQLATVGFTWTLSPTFLIDGNFGYTRFDQVVFGPDYGKNWGTDVWQIPGTNGSDLRQSGQPMLTDLGYESWGNTDTWEPLFRNDRSFLYSTNLTKVRGPHELRFGFDMIRHQLNHWQPELGGGPRGWIQFAGDVTALNGGDAANYMNSFAAALLGMPANYYKSVQFLLMTAREWQFGWYARDRWQVSRNLTLNLGLRYEYYPLMTRDGRGMERWDPVTNNMLMGGKGSIPENNSITTSKRLFSPRIGVAYRMGDNMVVRTGYGISYDPLPFARPLRGLYPATIAATFNRPGSYVNYNLLNQGIPAVQLPDISSGVIPLPNTIDPGPRSPWAGMLHRGYIQSWNFTIERKLPDDMLVSAAYVGTQTVHQLADRDINYAPLGGGNSGRPLVATQNRNIPMYMWDGWLSANYNALQISLNKSFAGGLLLKGGYTYSKAISLTDEDGWASLGRNLPSQLAWNRSRTGYDRTQMLVMGFVYELPFGGNKKYATTGTLSKLLGGWQTNGAFGAYTGLPFTVTADSAALNTPGNTQTADQVGPATKVGGIGPGEPFYNPLAFRQPTGQRFGTMGRYVLSGPGMVNFNFSLFRTFKLTERLKMEFKAESYNFTNTPHFANPSTTSVANMKLDSSNNITSLGNFLCVTSALSDERQFRFGTRFSF